MKKNKVLSLFIALIMVFACAFCGISEAAQVGTSNGVSIKQSQGVSKKGSAYKPSSIKSGNYMYYAVYDKIYKVNVNTRKSTFVYTSKSGYWFSDLAIKDGWIYCTMDKYKGKDGLYPYIFKVKTNGKSAKTLKQGMAPVIYNGNIYYIKYNFDMKDDNKNVRIVGLYRMSLLGKNDKCILKSDDIVDLAIYKSKIYYIIYSDNGCYLYNISTSGGKSKRMFCNSKAYIESIKIYSDYVYFNYGENIYKAKINSTKKTKVMSNATLKDVSEGYIYYTTQGDDSQSLYKMRIKNKAKTFIKKQKFEFGDVTVEGGYILMTLYYRLDADSEYDAAEYLCNTNGKNGKLLKTYFVY